MEDPILISHDGDVATVTINREQRRNALDHHAMIKLGEVLAELATSATKVIVLTGAGSKSFCAGDDVKAYKERTKEESRAHYERGLRVFDSIATHPCLVIAAIEGYCVGGGLELALCCDHRIASTEAHFELPEVRKLRAFPSWGGLTRLPRLIGLAAAKRLALMGEALDAQATLRIGLVDRVVEAGTALRTAQEVAADYAGDVDRDVVAVSKRLLLQATEVSSSALQLFNLLCERAQTFEGDIN
jgi:enoyl-CoA hydratase/carnithine racemase